MNDRKSLQHRALHPTVVIVSAILVALIANIGCGDRSIRPKGVILISLDTLRADHLGCYGYARPTSPFLDVLAEGGTRFENAIVQLPGTLPSHMSMLTGLLPAEHAVLPPDGVLADEIPILPELLAAAGVRTAGFTEGGYVSGRFGFARGFEVFDDAALKTNTDVEDVFERGLGFLQTIGGDDRFFLLLHTYAVHDPYYPPLPYTNRYLPGADGATAVHVEPFPVDGLRLNADDPRPEIGPRHRAAVTFVEDHLPPGAVMPTGPGLADVNRGRAAIPDRETLDYYIALYDASINYLDDVLRSLFHRIDELGLADETVVIITSDHGEEFAEHGRLVHEQVYHECLHVPLIVVGPGVERRTTVEELVMSIDLTPTILELLEVEAPSPMTGRSLVPALLGRPGDFEGRDAHAMGFADPSEALYRRHEPVLHQLVAHHVAQDDDVVWVERELEIESYDDVLDFEARAYHRDRTVELEVDQRPAESLEIGTDWQPVSVSLGPDAAKHRIRLSSSTCDSPAAAEGTEDRRCLAIAIRGLALRRTQLFDVTADPAGRTDLSVHQPATARALMKALAAFHRQPIAAVLNLPLDEETAQRLRELGYIE